MAPSTHPGFNEAVWRADSATMSASLVPVQGSCLTAGGNLEEAVVLT
jgi:hypothetical protein